LPLLRAVVQLVDGRDGAMSHSSFA
jgi:hypothetical protein